VPGIRFAVAVRVPFLRVTGAFDAQQVLTIPQTKLMRKFGDLPID
jgi:hypothetical protein